MKKIIQDYSREELAEMIKPSFRSRQIYDWIYHKYASSFDEMKNLPKDLREDLEKEFSYDDPSLSASDPHEEHFYDDLDENFEVIDSSVESPKETKEVSDVSNEKSSEKTQKPLDQSSLQKKGESPDKDSSSDEERPSHKKNDGKPSSQS